MIKKFATISKFLLRSSRFIGILRGLLIFVLMTVWIYSGGVVVTEIYDKEGEGDQEILTIMWE